MDKLVTEQVEEMWALHDYEDKLIETYVPEADCLSRAEALELARERDLAAAEALRLSAT